MESVRYGFSEAVKHAYRRHPNPKVVYGDCFLDQLEFEISEDLPLEKKDTIALKKIAVLQELHLVKYRALLKEKGLWEKEVKALQSAPNYSATLYRIRNGRKEPWQDWALDHAFSDEEILRGLKVTVCRRFDEEVRRREEHYGRLVLFALILLCIGGMAIHKLI